MKKRIFHSNVRLILLTLAWFFLAGIIVRSSVFQIMGIPKPSHEKMRQLRELMAKEDELQGIVGWITLMFFLIITGIINNIFTYRLTKKIVQQLEPLNEGVRQIQNNNFSYRIDYREQDEFRPICGAFDEMASKLEVSAVQRQKNEANRRELIAGISHDLRTPLTVIKGYLEGMESGVASTPEMRRHYFNTIKNKTADMEHIIEQLFLFSKLDMDEFPLALRRVDIGPALSDMIEELSREYAMRGLDIGFLEIAHNIFVPADTLWLRSVVINILENSARYKTRERGRMDIEVLAANNAALLRFTDDGPGVSTEALLRLFEVFYRADPSRNKKGSGLGLAISAKIIERMGGAIHAELPTAGGLAIVISLPLAEEAA